MPRSPRSALIVAMAFLAFLAGLTGLREYDAFHHLAMGRELVTHGLWGDEPFLYPLGAQPPLPPAYWLGSIAFYAAQALGGLAGVVLLTGVAGAVTFAIATADAIEPAPPGDPTAGAPAPAWTLAAAALLPVALALGAWRLRAVSRPEVLGLAAFAWTLYALRDGRPRRLWAIPAVVLAWSNLHPSVVFGLGAAGLALLEAARATLRTRQPAARKRLLALGGVLAAALLVAALAPGGALGVGLGFARALFEPGPVDPSMEVARSLIIELQPPPLEILASPVGALLLLVPLGWLVARRRPRLDEVLLLLVLGGLASRSIRFVPWAAVAAAPLAGRDLSAGVARLRALRAPAGWASSGMARLAFGALLPLALAGAAAWSFAWLPVSLSVSMAEDLFPVRAADLLAEALPAAPGARIWNHLPAGGYLEWRLPGTKVFQDGRLLWAPGEGKGALHGPGERASFAPLERRWGFDALVAGFPDRDEPFFAPSSGHDPLVDRHRYALVGFDDGGLLYVRRDGALAGLAPREFRAAVPGASVPPRQLLDPARRAALEADYRRALRESPRCGVCRAGLWLMVAAAGDEAGANALLPGGTLPPSSNPFGHGGLESVEASAEALGKHRYEEGMRLVAQGDPRGAEEAFRRSLLLAEAGAAQYGLGLALEAEGRADEAAAAYRTALRQEPGGPWAVDAGARAQRLERAAPARP